MATDINTLISQIGLVTLQPDTETTVQFILTPNQTPTPTTITVNKQKLINESQTFKTLLQDTKNDPNSPITIALNHDPYEFRPLILLIEDPNHQTLQTLSRNTLILIMNLANLYQMKKIHNHLEKLLRRQTSVDNIYDTYCRINSERTKQRCTFLICAYFSKYVCRVDDFYTKRIITLLQTITDPTNMLLFVKTFATKKPFKDRPEKLSSAIFSWYDLYLIENASKLEAEVLEDTKNSVIEMLQQVNITKFSAENLIRYYDFSKLLKLDEQERIFPALISANKRELRGYTTPYVGSNDKLEK